MTRIRSLRAQRAADQAFRPVAARDVTSYILKMPVCQRCQGVEWVCENHDDKPWAKDKPDGCVCGAGVPCPDCNDLAAPSVKEVIDIVHATRGKGTLH